MNNVGVFPTVILYTNFFSKLDIKYCEIIIVRGEPMFVDFLGHPYQRIHGFISYLIFINIIPTALSTWVK
jgi:hypothetical protein